MKYSESWLREWVKLKIDRQELSHLLTMSGFEVEEIIPASATLEKIIIGEVISVAPHPKSEVLTVCEVSVGKKTLSIVCGAKNVRPALKVAVALVGAVVGDQKIHATTIKEVSSQGMLCSAQELGLSDAAEEILELPQDSPVGVDLRSFLQLNDYLFDISITPNRGDCLSIQGMSREIAALTKSKFTPIVIKPHRATIKSKKDIHIKGKAEQACPSYFGRVITNIDATVPTPIWMQEKLRRAGLRSINAVVDIMNFVMIELGQPMHAFDLDQMTGDVKVRFSKKGDRLQLLDGSWCELDDETLVIADQKNILALAGLMGGLDSGITLNSQHIFLESAFFKPTVIARSKQFYQIQSDASYRYERFVDPLLQLKALERATHLIKEIVGGDVGPISKQVSKKYLPTSTSIPLKKYKVDALLGVKISETEILRILKRLSFDCVKKSAGIVVKTPSFRDDVSCQEDLIEEVARLYGYNNIPIENAHGDLQPTRTKPLELLLQAIRQNLTNHAFNEVITYSFVEQSLQQLLSSQDSYSELSNPINSEMTVMRANLLPGLIQVLRYNLARQQHRVKIYEIGTCFVSSSHQAQPVEKLRLGGLISGLVNPQQWGVTSREVDFFDLKGEIESLFSHLHLTKKLTFSPEAIIGLHPGRCAKVFYDDQEVGIIGELHPNLRQELDIKQTVIVFEINIGDINDLNLSRYVAISKFPEIRRDLALIINEAIPAVVIQDTIRRSAGDWLKESFIFDVYQGAGIASGYKSVAVGLILQHPDRTLTDEEVALSLENVIKALKDQTGAELRS